MNKAEFIRAVFAAADKPVRMEFDGRAAIVRCPVCAFIGLTAGKIEISRTEGEIRYCICHVCAARFRAIGEAHSTRKKLLQIDKEEKTIDTKNKRKKHGRAKKRT